MEPPASILVCVSEADIRRCLEEDLGPCVVFDVGRDPRKKGLPGRSSAAALDHGCCTKPILCFGLSASAAVGRGRRRADEQPAPAEDSSQASNEAACWGSSAFRHAQTGWHWKKETEIVWALMQQQAAKGDGRRCTPREALQRYLVTESVFSLSKCAHPTEVGGCGSTWCRLVWGVPLSPT